MSDPTFIRTQTLIDILKCERLTHIVDIGASPINRAPYQALLDMGGCTITGFEPNETQLNILKERQDPLQDYLPYAVGDGSDKTLNICKGAGFTSLLEPSIAFAVYVGHFKRAMTVKDRVNLSTKRLDDIDEVGDFDLLKIDIQGGELDVFENGAKKMSDVVAVITEVAFIELYEDQPLLDAQMASLRKHDLILHKFQSSVTVPLRGPNVSKHPRVRRLRSQLIDGDAIFVKQVLPQSKMETEKLKHLALLADSVFGSFDLCLRCLEILEARSAIEQASANKYFELL